MVFLCAVLLLFLPALSFARPSTASSSNFGIANDYNVFVFDKGNFQQGGSEVQGRLAIGGDANIRNYNIGRLVPLFDAAVPYNTVVGGGGNAQTWSGTLYGSVASNGNTTTIRTPDVRGSVYALRALDLGANSGSGGTVQGDAVYGTTFRKDTNVTITGQARQATTVLPFSFATAESNLRNLSTALKGLTPNGTATVFSWNGIKCVGTRPGLNVFSVSGNDLKKCAGFEISVPSGATALINVTNPPTAGQMQGFGITLSGGADQSKVLWHFADAGSVKISGIEVKGSVLAPNATVNFDNGQIGGTLICQHLNTTGLFKHVPFTGDLTDSPAVTLLSLSVSPSSVIGGQANATGTVTLFSAAPSGGAVVTLGSSNNPIAGTPVNVMVAAGSTTATFPIVTTTVAMSTPVTISASYGGVGKSAPLTVNPPPAPTVLSFVVTPTSVVGGNNASAVVTLSAPAPVGGAVISLSSANTGVATIPASVTIPAGATQSATVTVTTVPVATSTNVVLTATYGGSSKTAPLTVTPPVLLSLSVSPASVKGGKDNATGTVTLSSNAPTGGLVVSLSSSATGAATTPASVTVAAGSTTATFTVTSKSVANDTNVTISATLAGVTKTATLQVLAPALVSVSVTPASVVGGNESQGKATIDAPAPTGGMTVAISSASNKVAAPNNVTIPAGATESASFNIATVAVATDTAATITGTLNGVSKSATLTIEAPKLVSVTLNPTSVQGGSPSTGTVTLSSPAPAGGLVVTLSDDSDKASTPASVTVAAGATTATFTASTIPIPATTTATITGTLNGTSKTAVLTITAAPLALATLTLNPESVVGGYSSEGTVTLSAPAPTGGQVVTLFSSLPEIAKLASSPNPTVVLIPAGQTSVTFPITTVRVAINKDAVIKAVLGTTTDPNAAGLTKTLTILPIHLSALSVSPVIVPSTPPDSVPGGVVAKGVVTISYPAPPGGLVINLASGNTAVATAPSSVTVVAGQTTAEFNVGTLAVATDTTVTFTATLAGDPVEAATDTLNVLAPTLLSLTLSPDDVAGGTSSTGTVTISGNAPAGGLVVMLSSSSTKATLPSPAQVTIPAGSNTATFSVATVAVGTDTTATITASLNGTSKTADLTIRAPKLVSLSLSPASVIGGTTPSPVTGTVTLSGPAPAGGLSVTLSVFPDNKTIIPMSVMVPQGDTTATFAVGTRVVPAETSATVKASLNGVDKSATLTILPMKLVSVVVVPTSVVGGSTTVVNGTVTIDAAVNEALVVSLVSNKPGAASVPVSVSIPAGQTTAPFTVTHTVVAAQTLATITGTLNADTKTATLTVTVYVPELALESVTVLPETAVGGQIAPIVKGTVTLNRNAPVDTVITLSANPSDKVALPVSITVLAGAKTATFDIDTRVVSTNTEVTITGQLGQGVPKSDTLLLTPVQLKSLIVNPVSVIGGSSEVVTGIVQLETAVNEAVTVTLTSDKPGAVGVPATVTVAKETVAISFAVMHQAVAEQAVATLTATLNGVSKTATLTVKPDTTVDCEPATTESLLFGDAANPNTVEGGKPVNLTVTLTVPAIAGGQLVTLSVTGPAADKVFLQTTRVLVPAGQRSVVIPATTKTVSAITTATVTASYHDSTKSVTLTLKPVPTGGGGPFLRSNTVKPATVDPGNIYNLPSDNPVPGVVAPRSYNEIFKNEVALSPFALASAFRQGQCGPLDVVFLLDTTGSMDDALTNIKTKINDVVTDIAAASGDNYRLSFVSFESLTDGNNAVKVRQPLTFDIDAFKQSVNNTNVEGGNGTAVYNLALETVIKALPAAGRPQTGDFTPFRANARKLLVLITDTLPGGGTGSTYNPNSDEFKAGNGDVFLFDLVQQASLQNFRVSTVFVAHGFGGPPGSDSETVRVLSGIADQGNGLYVETDPSGSTVSDAISGIVAECGSLKGSSQIIYVREDNNRNNYGPGIQITGPGTSTTAPRFARFDMNGLEEVGTVAGMHLRRAGSLTKSGNAAFDIEWGVRSYSIAGMEDFSPEVRSANSVPTVYTTGWELSTAFYEDLQATLGGEYPLLLADRVSSICGNVLLTDIPNAGAPIERNLLTFLIQPPGNPQIPAGGRLDITIPETIPSGFPTNGNWEIILEDTIVASSVNPNGWTVTADDTVYKGIVVAVPADAALGESFLVRFVGGDRAGQGIFDVISGNGNNGPPSALALSFETTTGDLLPGNIVTGGTTIRGRITLTAPARPGGEIVVLTSANPAVASLSTVGALNSTFVTVPYRQTSVTFPISTQSVSSTTPVPFAASLNGTVTNTLVVRGGNGTSLTAPILSGQAGSNSATLSWSLSIGAVWYTLERSTQSGGPYQIIFTGSATSFVDFALDNGTTYYYIARAYDYFGMSPYSNEVAATPTGGKVATPKIEPAGTSFTGSVQVSLSTVTTGAVIRYTSDGTEPGESSFYYGGPFTLTQTATIKARAYKRGFTPSDLASKTYTILPLPAERRGELTQAECDEISGWAWDAKRPTETTSVDIFIDGVLRFAAVPANLTRTPDTGGHNPHWFRVTTPADIKDGATHLVEVFHTGTRESLQNSPKGILCGGGNAVPRLEIRYVDGYYYGGEEGDYLPPGYPVVGSLVADGGLIDFGRVVLGVTNPLPRRTLFLYNTGDAPLTVAAFNPAAPFQLGANVSLRTLEKGAALVVPIVYNPTQAGTQQRLLSIASNDPLSAYDITLTGSAKVAEPRLSVRVDNQELAPGDTLDFGTTVVGVVVTKTLTVKNIGDGPLGLGRSLQTVLVNGQPQFSENFPAGGMTLAPGQSQTFTVTFGGIEPLGDQEAILTFQSGQATNTPFPITLTGNVVQSGDSTIGCDQTISDAISSGGLRTYQFAGTANQQIALGLEAKAFNGTPLIVTVEVYRPDDSTNPILTLSRGFFGGPPPGLTTLNLPITGTYLIKVTGRSGFGGAASGTYTLTLRCTPPPGRLEVTEAPSTDPGASRVVPNGGSVPYGTTISTVPLTRRFTLRNIGGGPLTINSINWPTGFEHPSVSLPITLNPGTGFSPGGALTFDIVFNPQQAGNISSDLVVNNSDTTANPFRATLTAEAVAATPKLRVELKLGDGTNYAELSPGTLINFGTTPVGTPVTRTFRLTNVGTGSLGLGSPGYPGGFTHSGPGDSTLAAGEATELRLTFEAPAEMQVIAQAFRIPSSDASSPFDLKVSATAAQPRSKIVVSADGKILAAGDLVDIGNTVVGSPLTKTFTVTNIGSAVLTFTPAFVTAMAPHFEVVGGATQSTVAVGSSITFDVRYKASSAGTQGGPLAITHNDPLTANPFQVSVRGTAAGLPAPNTDLECGDLYQAELTLSDTHSSSLVALGLLPSGQFTYSDRYTFRPVPGQRARFTLRSEAFDTFVTLIGPDGTIVSANNDKGVANLNAAPAPNTNSELVYEFPEVLPGSGVYTLEVTSRRKDAVGMYLLGVECDSVLEVSVDGGVLPKGATLDFGQTPLGIPVSKNLSIKNVGNAPITFGSVSWSDDFTRTSELPKSPLLPGETTTFTLRYNASTFLGPRTVNAVFNLVNSTWENPYTLLLKATAGNATAVTLVSVAVTPAEVHGGSGLTGTVTISGPAPSEGFPVTLAVSDTVAGVPSSVLVMPTGTTATFPITTNSTLTNKDVTLTATAPGGPKTATFRVLKSRAVPTVTLNVVTAAPYLHGKDIDLSATATIGEPGTKIDKVTFYVDGKSIGEGVFDTTDNRWELTWPNVTKGTYSLTATATDSVGEKGASSATSVTVVERKVPTPVITPATSSFSGTSITVSIAAGNQSPAGTTIYYTLNGSEPTPDSLVYRAPFSIRSTTTVKARAFASNYEPSDIASETYTRTSGGGDPTTYLTQVIITAPADGDVLHTQTQVRGNINGIGRWELSYRLIGEGDWVLFGQGLSTAAGVQDLAIFDPTLLLNGQYELRLMGYAPNGNVTQDNIRVTVEGNQKVGQFAFSVVDLTLPVAGIPIQITRSYDSRDKRVGDFGQGWTLSFSNIRLQRGEEPLGEGWQPGQRQQGNPFRIPEPSRGYGKHAVTVTMPDGGTYAFVPVVKNFQPLFGGSAGTIDWVPANYLARRGRVQLASTDESGDIFYANGDTGLNRLDEDGFGGDGIYDPKDFVLTLRDGTALFFTAGKLTQMRDRNKNFVVFDENTGIGTYDPSGNLLKKVRIVRTNGIVTRIIDPKNAEIIYSQVSSGVGKPVLASVTNRVGARSRYFYDWRGNMTAMVTPTGKVPMVNDYDAAGRLVKTTDAFNKSTTYAYTLGASGGTTLITDRSNQSTLFSFDQWGNTTATAQTVTTINVAGATIQQAVNTTKSYTDSVNPQMATSVTDALGKTTRMTYSADGDLLSTTDARNNTIRYTYSAQGDALSVEGPDGVVQLTHEYDNFGNPIRTTDALGNLTRTEYLLGGRPSRTIDPLGHASELAYDAFGNMATVKDAQGTVTEIFHDANGNQVGARVTRTVSPGTPEIVTSQIVVDGEDRVVATVAPTGERKQTVFDADGQVEANIDSSGRYTRYKFDAQGQQTEVLHADGSVTRTSYNANGLGQFHYDKGGRRNETVYDSAGRTVGYSRYEVSGITPYSTTRDALDQNGRTIASTDARGFTTQYQYDAVGNQIATIDALGQNTRTDYDAYNRAVKVTDPLGRVTMTEYDESGRVIGTTFPNGTSATTTFDKLGRVLSQTNANNETSVFTYDEKGQLISVTDATGNTTRYTYNEIGQKVTQVDALGRITRMAYDASGRYIGTRLPMGQSDYVSYRPDGRKDGIVDFNGLSTVYNYDTIGAKRLTSRISNTGSVSMTYDSEGRMKSLSRNGAIDGLTLTNQFDAKGRLTQIQGPVGIVNYAIDDAGLQTGVSSTSATTGYEYDEVGRVQSVIHKDGTKTRYHYWLSTDSGALTSGSAGALRNIERPNGVWTSYAYDLNGRIVGIRHFRANTNQTIQSFSYTLDGIGRRTSVTKANGASVAYFYNKNGWLTDEKYLGGINNGRTISYTYDAVGNRRSKIDSHSILGGTFVYNYDDNDRLFAVTKNGALYKSYTWDNNGRLTAVNTTQLTWDFENHLLSVGDTMFAYDGRGNRVQKANSLHDIRYIVDTSAAFGRIIEERNGAGGLLATYDLGINEVIRADKTGVGGGTSAEFPLSDALGSVNGVTDALGNLVGSDFESIDAFGLPLSGGTTAGTGEQTFFLNGQQYDSETGLYYLRARYYDPETGRFLSPDPYDGQDMNPLTLQNYLYAANDPVNISDPSGREGIISFLSAAYMSAVLRLNNASVSIRAKGGIEVGFALGALFGQIGEYAETGQVSQEATVNSGVVGMLMMGIMEVFPEAIPYLATEGLLASVELNIKVWQTATTPGQKLAAAFLVITSMFTHPQIGPKIIARLPSVKTILGIFEALQARFDAISCFEAGTLCQTSEGMKPIEKVKIGDLVWSRDPITNETLLKRVLDVSRSKTTKMTLVSLIDRNTQRTESVRGTPNHPFFTIEGQVLMGDLKIGMKVHTRNGALLEVTSVTQIPLDTFVYNLNVEDFHTYFVGATDDGMWVHNECWRWAWNMAKSWGRVPKNSLPVDTWYVGPAKHATGSNYVVNENNSHWGKFWLYKNASNQDIIIAYHLYEGSGSGVKDPHFHAYELPAELKNNYKDSGVTFKQIEVNGDHHIPYDSNPADPLPNWDIP